MYWVSKHGELKLLPAAALHAACVALEKCKFSGSVTAEKVHQWVYLMYTRAGGEFRVPFSNLGETERKSRLVSMYGSKLFKTVEETERVESIKEVAEWIQVYRSFQYTQIDKERELMLEKLEKLDEALKMTDYMDAEEIKRESLLLSNRRQLAAMLSELDVKRAQESESSEHLLGVIALFERPDEQMPSQMRSIIREAEEKERELQQVRSLGIVNSI